MSISKPFQTYLYRDPLTSPKVGDVVVFSVGSTAMKREVTKASNGIVHYKLGGQDGIYNMTIHQWRHYTRVGRLIVLVKAP